jgi:hypothetical protein
VKKSILVVMYLITDQEDQDDVMSLAQRIKTMTLTVYIGGLAYALATDELAPMMTEWYHVVRLKRKTL